MLWLSPLGCATVGYSYKNNQRPMFCVRSLQVKSQLLQTLNGFASSVNLSENTDFAEVITPDITVQVSRILKMCCGISSFSF